MLATFAEGHCHAVLGANVIEKLGGVKVFLFDGGSSFLGCGLSQLAKRTRYRRAGPEGRATHHHLAVRLALLDVELERPQLALAVKERGLVDVAVEVVERRVEMSLGRARAVDVAF